jgi:hypothetical protein
MLSSSRAPLTVRAKASSTYTDGVCASGSVIDSSYHCVDGIRAVNENGSLIDVSGLFAGGCFVNVSSSSPSCYCFGRVFGAKAVCACALDSHGV